MSEGAAPAKSSHGQQLTRQQKAAAVIVSLGTEKASQLYQYMDPEDVEGPPGLPGLGNHRGCAQ